MIHQYAVEPECLANWERLRLFLSQCGAHNGRLIVEFPREWIQDLRDLFRGQKGIGEVKQKMIEERLWQAQQHGVFSLRAGSPKYSSEASWLDNALTENKRCPFDGIVAAKATETNEVMTGDTFDGDHRWQVQRSVTISRTAAEIAKVVEPLMRISRIIRIVDPYFLTKSHQPSYQHMNSLREIFSICGQREFSILEYHCGDQGSPYQPDRWKVNNQKIRDALPPDLRTDLVIWPQQDLHNRFILSERGGLQFGHGLGVSSAGSSDTDDVFLLDFDHWKSRQQEFKEARSGPAVKVHPIPFQREIAQQMRLGTMAARFSRS